MPASRDFGGDDRPLTATRPGPSEQANEEAVVPVADEGAGIAPAELPRLFQRFRRLRTGTEQAEVESIGLGLYIARLIVDAHGVGSGRRAECPPDAARAAR